MPERLRYPEDWIKKKAAGEKIALLTAYDASMAGLASRSSLDALLVGDSLGMCVQGENSTLGVSLDEMIYHSRLVHRGAPEHFIIGDMPFGSYQCSIQDGMSNAIRLMKESGITAVKLEGATAHTLRLIKKLGEAGVPVMAHIGLTPQSYLVQGGFRIQGKDEKQARELFASARRLEDAGCFAIVLELMEAHTAQRISRSLQIPTIGIGSGPHTDGQVQVLHDLLGLDPDFHPRHARAYASLSHTIIKAFDDYSHDTKSGSFPE